MSTEKTLVPKKSRKPSFARRIKHLAERRDPDTGKLVPTHLRDWERADILTLYRSGHSIMEIADLTERSRPTVRRVILDERQKQEGELGEEYLQAHRRATVVAAEQGNAQPAMEMLDRLGLVPATSKDRLKLEAAVVKAEANRAIGAGRQPTAPVINIGIGLPGVSGQAPDEHAVTVSSSRVKALNQVSAET